MKDIEIFVEPWQNFQAQITINSTKNMRFHPCTNYNQLKMYDIWATVHFKKS